MAEQNEQKHLVREDEEMQELRKVYKRLYTDALTGAYNRRYYEDHLRGKYLSAGIAMIDLDDFKLCNDTFGHQAGDSVLRTAAGIIQQNIRGTDFLVRYGGDELLLVLPEIDRESFERKLNNIKQRLGMAIIPGYERMRISASIGGVLSAGTAVEDAVREADRRMYLAKRQKNAVVTDNTGLDAAAVRPEEKPLVLVVDDSEMNRELLRAILQEQFRVAEADSGLACMKRLEEYSGDVALVLLDIVMPDMDGFEVLDWMNSHGLIDEVPVIMISSEDRVPVVRRAYELGAVDYISRPFDARVVQRRVGNTTRLYAKQRRLNTMLAQQFYEREKNDRIMIGILSRVMALHNGEDGDHVRRVQRLTGLLLDRLAQKTDRYDLSAAQRSLIATASALHDIGKIAVGGGILRKKEPLTPEEAAHMREHPMLGVNILSSLKEYQDEPLVCTAREICHWHHERYDGTGYPDGLVGEEIPIAAQVVGLADACDGLITARPGRAALTCDEAVRQLTEEQKSHFNPLLLECLAESQSRIKEEFA